MAHYEMTEREREELHRLIAVKKGERITRATVTRQYVTETEAQAESLTFVVPVPANMMTPPAIRAPRGYRVVSVRADSASRELVVECKALPRTRDALGAAIVDKAIAHDVPAERIVRAASAVPYSFHMYTEAQRNDGTGLSFMTAPELQRARTEWSAQLRTKVKASDEERKRRELYQVRVDIQDID